MDLLKKLLVRMARQSPALIVAMLALFVALTGTAVATTSALIGSAQIRNNSITGLDVKNKSLTPKDFRGSIRGPRGLRGLTGATGAPGAPGAKGDKGDKGDAGPLVNTLPAGATLRGMYAWADRTAATGYNPVVPLTYPYPLPSSPTINVIAVGGASTANCPGTVADPQALPGHLCVYQQRNDGNLAFSVLNEVQGGRFGAVLYFPIADGTDYEYEGTWAVTAPLAAAAVTSRQSTASSN